MSSSADRKSGRPPVRRWLVPALVLLGWLVVGGIGGPFAGKLSEVAENDSSTFLPESAESTDVAGLDRQFVDQQVVPAIVVAERAGGVAAGDESYLAARSTEFAEVDGVVGQVSPPLPSDDGEALRVIVPVDAGVDPAAAVERIRDLLAAGPPDGLTVLVTGPAALGADLGRRSAASTACCSSWRARWSR